MTQVMRQSGKEVIWTQDVATISNFRNVVTLGACVVCGMCGEHVGCW